MKPFRCIVTNQTDQRRHAALIYYQFPLSAYYAADDSSCLIRRFCHGSRWVCCRRVDSLSKRQAALILCPSWRHWAYLLPFLIFRKGTFFIMLHCSWSNNRDQCSSDIKTPKRVLEALFLVRCVLPCSSRGRQWHTLVWQEVFKACFQHRVICSFN